MIDLRLYIVQRATAVVMLPFILAHLFVIFYATANGLSAAEILGRTRGSTGWAVFYGLFVVLASAHGAIGIRTILREWLGLGHRSADIAALAFAVLLVVLGVRAVIAVVVP